MPSLPDLRPMLASRADEAFDSRDHIFELKWAGIRALAFVEGARLRLLSQSGREITAWFPELTGIVAQVKGDGVMLDGEIVALGPEGEPDLGLLAGRLAGGAADDGAICVFQAYDLLYKSGASFMDRTLLERKDALAILLRDSGPAVLTDYVPDDGLDLFEAASGRRLPGIVAKAKASRYHPGRVSNEWTEVPAYETGAFVIGGYTLGVGKEEPVAGLLLGEPAAPQRLRFVAHVQGNIGGAVPEAALSPFATPACPFASAPELPRLVYWLKPEVVAQVKYARREPNGRLRFPVVVSLRPDLAAKDLWQAARPGRTGPTST
jgi:bifunctional non-homologous end joining protein LigD